MIKFSTEMFTKTLREIPKTQLHRKQYSEGYKYLLNEMCIPVISKDDIGFDIDFDRFTMDDINDVIDDFYNGEFERIQKTDKTATHFVKCNPATRKVAFI